MTGRLEVGSRVAAVLRPEEVARLSALREASRLRCPVCGRWIDAGSADHVTLSLSLEGDAVMAEFAHASCALSDADLGVLVAIADAEPQGIAFRQALHPEAGAVLLWERRLDVRAHGPEDADTIPYLEAQRRDGFHGALRDEPVRHLAGLRLEPDGGDLVLRRDEEVVERFYDAAEGAPDGWIEALRASGFALLIVGAHLGLRTPSAGNVQSAIRAGRALMGLVELDEHP